MKNNTHDKKGQTLKSRDVEIALYEVQSVWERRGINIWKYFHEVQNYYRSIQFDKKASEVGRTCFSYYTIRESWILFAVNFIEVKWFSSSNNTVNCSTMPSLNKCVRGTTRSEGNNKIPPLNDSRMWKTFQSWFNSPSSKMSKMLKFSTT